MSTSFYWRTFGEEDLYGPADKLRADRAARKLSQENSYGASELVIPTEAGLEVIGIYVRGILKYQGKRARDASRNNLPPSESSKHGKFY